MADISLLLRLVSGVIRNVDIAANTLVTTSIKVGGLTPTELTKTILDRLISLQNGTDVDATYHTHDGRYYTETELGSQANGASGASKIGIDVTPAFTNFTSGSNVQSALEGIDAALGAGANDIYVKVSAADTTADYLGAKIQGDIGTNATNAFEETIQNPGANEILRLRFDASKVDHGALVGLADDDHTQYILVAGTRAFTGDQSMGGFKLTSLAAGSASGHSVRYEQVILRDGTNAFTAAQSMGGFKLTNLADPTAAQDAVTKFYADSLAAGLDPKESVRAATTAVLSGTMIADNGTPATGERTYNTTTKTITWFASEGPTAIDGVTLANGNRILLKNETATSGPSAGEGRIYNGIYVRTSVDVWTRATDHDGSPASEVSGGNFTFVEQGTANVNSGWVLQGDGILTLQTHNIIFTQFSGAGSITAGAGLLKTGNTIDVVSANTGIVANADNIELFLATNSGLEISSGLKVAASIAGSALSLSSGVLNVNVDDSTIEVNSDALRLKALGITNAHISASAAIAYSKLALTNSIVNADIAAGAAIAYSKLALTNSIVLGDLTSLSVDENKLTASVAGAGLTGGAGAALAVGANADGTIVVNANDIQVAHAPMVKRNGVAGEAFAANTSFAVRMAVSGETAGRWYKADYDATTLNNFYVYGVIEGNGATAKTAGDAIVVVMMGAITLGSSDTAFAAGEIGEAVHLKASGAWDAVSQITYATNQASYRFGMVQTVSTILIGNMQLLGIN